MAQRTKESKIKRDNHIVIHGWMLTDLKLKGNELIIYALIYGFSQNVDNQRFSGSLQYIADWTNSTKQGVMKSLKSLESKGFIGKNEMYINNVKFCEYYATKFNGVFNKVEQGMQQSLMGGMQQSSPNNIDLNNINNNIENSIGNKRFTPPTLEEVSQYCNERQNGIDPQRFIDYYTSNGWKVGRNPMKDWKAAIRTWESKETTTKPKIDVVPPNTETSKIQNEKAITLYAEYIERKLNRKLTHEEMKEVGETINNDPVELAQDLIKEIDKKDLKSFKEFIDVYLEESLDWYLNQTPNF